MPVYEAPGVYYERADARTPVIAAVRTDVTGFVGLAPRGPVDEAVPVESFRQFQAHFGPFSGSAFLAYAVRGFFENGGRRCWIARVASREPGRGCETAQAMFELRYPGSLIEFKPTLTTANQVKSVTVRGWNRKTKEPINETVTLDDPKLNRNTDLYGLLKKCDPREERVVNEAIFTRKQARDRAIVLLKERQKDMVKCTGSTVGLPQLRAGRKVHIKGVGPVFSGTYFITETTHTIGANGYTTNFSARREDDKKANGKEKGR